LADVQNPAKGKKPELSNRVSESALARADGNFQKGKRELRSWQREKLQKKLVRVVV
jgi:hypothetical protein